MPRISYAVVALKRNQVDVVIRRLRDRRLNATAAWLDAHKDALYGDRTEDWKPFGEQTVPELLNSEEDYVYYSETHLIDALDEELTNTKLLVKSGIEIFFIDVFALFLDWHNKLAAKLDLMIANNDQKCCLVMPQGLSGESTAILASFGAIWGGVAEAYLQGAVHPIVMRPDDLTHLRNYLLALPRSEEEPDKKKLREMDTRYGSKGKPEFGAVRFR